MRNTKPPLLFWQAMVAGDWGRNWSLAALRTPSVIYTFLLAGAVGWTVHLITRNVRSACIAACVYLAFFCTFRFGRTYLTSAPETFWLSLPMFWLLWARLCPSSAVQVGWLTHLAWGLALGLGLAYKSFALIAPAGAALWCAQLISAPVLTWRVVAQTTLKMTLTATLALGVFALWFVLDPDPGAVWQEFVIGENAGKLSSTQGYWHIALAGGGFSIWAQSLAYVQNAGLLAFVVLGLMVLGVKLGWQAWHDRQERGSALNGSPDGQRSVHTLILLMWLAVWLIVFTLPSQRSARYVIPAMPAVAMLVALYWDRIGRGWFVSSLLVCGVLMGVLGRMAWAAHDIGIGSGAQLSLALLAMAAGLCYGARWPDSAGLDASLYCGRLSACFFLFWLDHSPFERGRWTVRRHKQSPASKCPRGHTQWIQRAV
jgi:4-amino-4-deoxy-L-arabinose transferase-like glycosyltransferase